MTASFFWLASYPKSGSTWLRAFLHNLLTESPEPASINDLTTGAIASARNWIDDLLGFDTADLYRNEVARLRPDSYRFASTVASAPQYFKIHDANVRVDGDRRLIDLDATAGALYLIRNPLDVAISLANHNGCSIDRAIDLMADAGHCLSPHADDRLHNQVEQRLLTWSSHVESWVDDPELETEVLRYEDMGTKPQHAFAAAAAFLRIQTDPANIDRAIRHSQFEGLQAQEERDSFRERSTRSSRFFRKGQIGDWKRTLTRSQINRIVDQQGAVMARFGYLDSLGDPWIG